MGQLTARRIRGAAKVLWYPRFALLYWRFRHATMVPGNQYFDNLRLARRARSIEGDVVECGTWRGGMIASISQVLGPVGRRYVLFDSFEGLPPATTVDGPAALEWQRDTTSPGYHDNCTASEADARDSMARAGARDVRIVKGWFEDTLPGYVAESPRIAVLRLDGDWYDSTMTCLRALYPHVVDGGLVIVDDYDTWDGCARAVHDYLSETAAPVRIEHLDTACFIRKVVPEPEGTPPA